MSLCAYADCEREAAYQCLVCKARYCAFHIYDTGGYICNTDFDEPRFEDPHAPKSSGMILKERFNQWWSWRRD